MKPKVRLTSTPFPLQTIFGDKVNGFESTRNPRTISTNGIKGEGEGSISGTGKNRQGKVIRTVFREKAEVISTQIEKMKFSKTYTNRYPSFNETGKQELFLPQETIAGTQGLLHTVLHQPRLSTMDKELVIVNVEGIIANCFNREVCIRAEAAQVLRELNGRYQVVLVSGWKLARFLKLISYLSSKGIYISAAYKIVASGGNTTEEFDRKRHEWYLDYNRIYKDFKISTVNFKKVVVVSPFMACPDDIEQHNMVAEYTGSLRPIFYVRKAPVPTKQFQFAPLTLLIPHMGHVPISISPVPDALRQLFTLRSFSSFYHSSLSVFSCNTIHKELLYLYHQPKRPECLIQTFVLLKSGSYSEIISLHKESYIQRLNCENLLEFTLSFNL